VPADACIKATKGLDAKQPVLDPVLPEKSGLRAAF